MPVRDPGMAKVGQGFSKMLAMIHTDQLALLNRGVSQQASNTAANFYPPQEGTATIELSEGKQAKTIENQERRPVRVVTKSRSRIDTRLHVTSRNQARTQML